MILGGYFSKDLLKFRVPRENSSFFAFNLCFLLARIAKVGNKGPLFLDRFALLLVSKILQVFDNFTNNLFWKLFLVLPLEFLFKCFDGHLTGNSKTCEVFCDSEHKLIKLFPLMSRTVFLKEYHEAD